jgi:hypothetical protein
VAHLGDVRCIAAPSSCARSSGFGGDVQLLGVESSLATPEPTPSSFR